MLFIRDIFSEEKPCYSLVDSKTATGIIDVLRSAYFKSSAEVQEILKVGALEINSQNFFVRVNDVSYHVKRLSHHTSLDLVNAQYNLSEFLRKRGHSFPEIISTKQSRLIAIDRNHQGWIVTRFEPGNYFSGLKRELPAVAGAIGNLFHDLASDGCKQFTENIVLLNSAALPILNPEFLLSSIIDSDKSLPPSDYSLLSSHFKIIENAVYSIRKFSSLLTINENCISHIVLHPHNLLTKSDWHPVFLDVESLRPHPRLMSIGFGIYKLMRQFGVMYTSCSNRDSLIAKYGLEMCRVIIHKTGLNNIEASLLPYGATFEVCRRLNIILELNAQHGSILWNKIFPIHLAGLREIPIIFASLLNKGNQGPIHE